MMRWNIRSIRRGSAIRQVYSTPASSVGGRVQSFLGESHVHPRTPASVSAALELEPVPCPPCGGHDGTTLGWLHDVALGVPGRFPLARCRGCGLLQQNPRVREDQLDRAYPDNYPPHTRDAEMPRMLRHAGPAVRWALATRLGYQHLATSHTGAPARGWPRPLAALARMIGWLAPGGLLIVEVPNAGGAGGRLFGRYWIGLDFPRHLVHFTPATMTAMVERAGGRVVAASHRTKPRYLTRSLRHWLREQPGARHRLTLAALDSRLGRGAAKLTLELLMPINRPLGLG